MSRPKERDEQEALKLDESFKETLSRIRPHLLALNSPENAQLCRAWLDKLSHSSSQRVLRNEYLVELYRQLQSGHLGGIFIDPPVNGPLSSLSTSYHPVNLSSSQSDLSEVSSSTCHKWKRPSNFKASRGYSRSKTPSRPLESDSSSSVHCVHGVRISSQMLAYEEGQCSEKNKPKTYKQRIETLSMIIKELQMENEKLRQDLSRCQEKCISGRALEMQENIDELNAEVARLKAKLVSSMLISSIPEEVTHCRRSYLCVCFFRGDDAKYISQFFHRLADTQQMNSLTEANHREVIQRYKTAVTEQFKKLKTRLQEAQSRNITLDNTVLTITQQLEEMIRVREIEANTIEKEWKQNLDSVQKHYEELLEEKERELRDMSEIINSKDNEQAQKDSTQKEEIDILIGKIQDLEKRLGKKIEDESRLQVVVTEQCTAMKEEFGKMRTDMELAMQRQNQSLVNKNTLLKRGILKLEKSREKLRQEYEKKIFRILKDKELEIETLQLRLQGQRSELSTSLSSEKQCELDSMVGSLEDRYKALFAAVGAAANSQRETYLKKISVLEGQLTCLKQCIVEGETS
ncbi:golgin subfamily A member 4 [Orussus abietinus]|uniref:golgin subfamily A member 4 n=1 Tax=Orussus abietinus TaxID=222816 RepID=UPI000C7161CC|nr:golgin subfamily A member 4 [Orussus abietinus]